MVKDQVRYRMYLQIEMAMQPRTWMCCYAVPSMYGQRSGKIYNTARHPKERWQHNLENGCVVMLYHPGMDIGQGSGNIKVAPQDVLCKMIHRNVGLVTAGCPRINYLFGFGFYLNKNIIHENAKEMYQ
jgi:hypothetical protein